MWDGTFALFALEGEINVAYVHGGDIYNNKIELDFSVNINPFGMPHGVRRALHRAVEHVREYPDPQTDKLKGALARQVGVPKETLLFGNGASELFMGIVHALRPRKILLPIPSFYGYQYAAQAAGCEIQYLFLPKEQEFSVGEELLLQLNDTIDMVFLANPNNPTGRCIPQELLRRLLAVCRDREIYVVVDECFLPFCEGEVSIAGECVNNPNVILVEAFTKLYAIPGVRLGYLICQDACLLQKIRAQLPEWNISVFAQAAGLACIEENDFAGKTAAYVKRERANLSKQLEKMGIKVFPGEGVFLFVYSKEPLYELLLKRGILIRDCSNFLGLTKGYYRIAIKRRRENKILLRKLGECLV